MKLRVFFYSKAVFLCMFTQLGRIVLLVFPTRTNVFCDNVLLPPQLLKSNQLSNGPENDCIWLFSYYLITRYNGILTGFVFTKAAKTGL